ncbi:hypothetical protein HPG69_018699, partial [Diceros bicornis minor]
ASAWRRGPATLPAWASTMHLTLGLRLRRRFGNVFSLQLAWTPAVVLHGLAAMREALVDHGEDTAHRPPAPIFQHLSFGPRSEGKRSRRGPRPGGDWAHSAPRPDRAKCRQGGGPAVQGRVSEFVGATGGGRSLCRGTGEPKSKVCAQRQGRGSPSHPHVLAPPPGLVFAHFARAWREQRCFSVSTLRNFGLGKKSREQWPQRPPEKSSGQCNHLSDLWAPLRVQGPALPQAIGLNTGLTEGGLWPRPEAQGNPKTSLTDENLRQVVTDLFTAGMVTTSITLTWAL